VKLNPSEARSGININSVHEIAAAEWNDILAGKTHLYVFVIFAYRDDTLKEGEYWLHEYCGHIFQNPKEFFICAQKTYLFRHSPITLSCQSQPPGVCPYPGFPGFEAIATCLASPEVRERTEGVIAWRPQFA
jgi:hypothetical protein